MAQQLTTEGQFISKDREMEGNSFAAWKWVLSLTLVTVLALFLRIMAVDYHSFWYDEAVTAKLTEATTADLIQGRVKDNGNPPLYWVLARGWSSVFGRSEIGFRSLSVLFGVLTIPIIAILGRRLLSPAAGLLAGSL